MINYNRIFSCLERQRNKITNKWLDLFERKPMLAGKMIERSQNIWRLMEFLFALEDGFVVLDYDEDTVVPTKELWGCINATRQGYIF